MTGHQEPLPVLDYGRPTRPVSPHRVFAGIFGVAAGLSAVATLLQAVLCVFGSVAGYLLLIFGLVLIVLSRQACRFARGHRP
jgi:hypothetical protein